MEEVGHQDGITLHILTTAGAFNRSVLTLENNKKKRMQLMWFHVHSVLEPSKIHCCLTVDSTLDTHFRERKKKKYAVTHCSSFIWFWQTQPSSFFLSSFIFLEKTSFKPAEFPKRAANFTLKTKF